MRKAGASITDIERTLSVNRGTISRLCKKIKKT